MFEQFGNYPEIRWTAVAAARFIGIGNKISVNPDLENFRLVRFKDLRKQPKINEKSHLKLMLIGSSNTNIFIDGPDSLLDEMVTRLPQYRDKSWTDIKNMSLERDFSNCGNAYSRDCDPWILDNMELKPIGLDGKVPELDLAKADEICAKCEHYEFKLE